MKHVAIIGAGLGGLATAIRLAHSGFRVTVLEKNARVGGKMNIVREQGYTFDTGPSLLTMPFVLEDLFQSAGEDMRDHLHLQPVDPICRYAFPDGSALHAWQNRERMKGELNRFSPGSGDEFDRFMKHAEGIYSAAAEPFLFQSFGSLDAAGVLKSVKQLPVVFKLDAFRSLNACVEGFFRDARLRQLFNRFATYNGSSPYLAPATLASIPYIEFAFGGWYVSGGMYNLALALERLAERSGVEVRKEAAVSRILTNDGRARGVTLASGVEIASDAVVCNADVPYARRQLLREGGGRSVEPSLGGFIMLLGVKKQFSGLAHHNVFFSENYPAEFDAMVKRHEPACDPTIYVCATSLVDPTHAPAGCTNLFVLVNAPALESVGTDGRVYDWGGKKEEYRDVVLRKLEQTQMGSIQKHIEYEELVTPLDFESAYNAFRGSIYGTSSNSRMSAFMRPANKSRSVEHLYFVGGSSHPGGGIPLVLLSGKIVSGLVMEELGIS